MDQQQRIEQMLAETEERTKERMERLMKEHPFTFRIGFKRNWSMWMLMFCAGGFILTQVFSYFNKQSYLASLFLFGMFVFQLFASYNLHKSDKRLYYSELDCLELYRSFKNME